MSADLRLVGAEWDDPTPRSPWAPAVATRLLDGPVHYPLHGTERSTGCLPDDLGGHLARYGTRPTAAGAAGAALIDALQEIALTGRGGAHFPAAIKWRTVLRAGGGGVVVANGAEGEPASAKDAALLQHRPHLVLDGLACAAEAVGAERAVVWLHRGATATHRAVMLALAERHAAGLLELPVEVVEGPDHYLSGESSAVVRALSGGPALPAFVRVPSAVSGVDGRPTLVHNAETLARVGLVARTGAEDWSPTTTVTTMNESGRTVVEVASDTVVADLFGTDAAPPSAVLLGGYGGTWVPWSVAAGLPLGEPAMRAAGFSLGAGVVAALPAGACGLTQTAELLAFLARSSARQCGPCVFGLGGMSSALTAVADGRGTRGDLRRLRRYVGEVEGRGACHHPDGAVSLVRSALHTFAGDLRAHGRGRCEAVTSRAWFPVGSAAGRA